MSSVRTPSVCPSVCLSVTFLNQDHIGWKFWKLIARPISPKPSLFVAQRPSTYTSRGTWGNFGETRGVWEKVACWSTKAAISLKRVRIEEKLFTNVLSNATIPDPLRLPLPKDWGFASPKLQSLLSQELVTLRTSSLAGTFTGSIRTKAH